ncbi:tyrosine-type recombinase/integrase [Microbulbifer thermotolerans]|uniref:tyrosine-type recombinase/integrase n=1 Tax=Microbulbifer thermotolerans TaxID=252514 RepID=UPI0008F1470F|nr:site-specific integrase [Microbulbifer thermotolerans]MCX2832928.1 site-specific integrase [Microbulbifer thermotolerans]SFC06918.1 Site-specific recombinase XerD [Microbulbifer thermotolerans]
MRYQAQVRLKGFPPQNATFNRKTDAKRWIQQTEAAIREGRHFKTTESKRRTLAKLIDRYLRDVLPTKPKGMNAQGRQLTWWKKELGCRSLADVTPSLLAETRDKLHQGRQPATVVRYMAALSHAFTVAVNEWEWLEDNPMRKVRKPKEPRGRVRFLGDDERHSLLSACKASDCKQPYPVVVLALSTGMRQSEIMGLKRNDIDLKRGYITLHETKNGERRAVPLVGHAKQLIQQLAKVRRLDTDLLFFSEAKPSAPIFIRSPWGKALREAGIEDFKFHDLRHTAASRTKRDNQPRLYTLADNI